VLTVTKDLSLLPVIPGEPHIALSPVTKLLKRKIMPRPIKRGLSYFPLDTDFMRDRKVQRLILEYGAEGIAVFIGVLCEIYQTNGYYLPVTGEVYFDIGFTLQMNEERVKEIVGYCVKIRLFDAKVFKSNRIITSCGVQQRYMLICKRAKNEIDKAICLLPADGVNVTKTPVNVAKTRVNVTETPVSAAKTPLKGKGNIKGKKKERKKETKKELNYECEQSEPYEEDLSGDAGAAARRRELLEMAREAAAGDRHA